MAAVDVLWRQSISSSFCKLHLLAVLVRRAAAPREQRHGCEHAEHERLDPREHHDGRPRILYLVSVPRGPRLPAVDRAHRVRDPRRVEGPADAEDGVDDDGYRVAEGSAEAIAGEALQARRALEEAT